MSGMIPDQYEAAIRATLVDLRAEFGGNRERTAAFLRRAAARFVGDARADTALVGLLLELQGQPQSAPEQPATKAGPKKIAHGSPSPFRSPESPDASSEREVDGMNFRIYELGSDKPVGRQAVAAGAIRVRDGLVYADDFIADSGQVLVWDHFDNGTADDGHEVYENPARLKNDSRIRYRSYESVRP